MSPITQQPAQYPACYPDGVVVGPSLDYTLIPPDLLTVDPHRQRIDQYSQKCLELVREAAERALAPRKGA
jgi:hypothetical protein